MQNIIMADKKGTGDGTLKLLDTVTVTEETDTIAFLLSAYSDYDYFVFDANITLSAESTITGYTNGNSASIHDENTVGHIRRYLIVRYPNPSVNGQYFIVGSGVAYSTNLKGLASNRSSVSFKPTTEGVVYEVGSVIRLYGGKLP